MARVVAIIQARVGSFRLPGKVFADICGKPMLQRVYERIKKARLLDDVMIATSFAKEDYQIVQWGQRKGIPIYQGGKSVNDVLGRYWDVAQQVKADVIVRVTADCPMIEPIVIDQCVLIFGAEGAGYVTNTVPPTYPDGLDVEVFDWAALNQAHLSATNPLDREHVTPWVRRALPIHNVEMEGESLAHHRWTVDETADLKFVRAVYFELGEDFGMEDVLALLERKPKLAQINAHIGRNEGYKKSLEAD